MTDNQNRLSRVILGNICNSRNNSFLKVFLFFTAIIFKEITIQRPSGNIVVSAPNHTDKTFYIQSVKVNGKECPDGIMNYDDIRNGGRIDYILKK